MSKRGPGTHMMKFFDPAVQKSRWLKIGVLLVFFHLPVSIVSAQPLIRTVAGSANPVSGGPAIIRTHTGDGGPSTSAGLAFPSSLAFDTNGNLYVADSDLNSQG